MEIKEISNPEKATNFILNLGEQYYPNIEQWWQKQIPKIKNNEVKCLIAEDNGIIGIAIHGLETEQKNTAKLKTFFVKENHRKLGIGNQLMKQVIEHWKEKVNRIFITIPEERKKELSPFLEKYGFKIYEQKFGFYRPNKIEYFMEKLF